MVPQSEAAMLWPARLESMREYCGTIELDTTSRKPATMPYSYSGIKSFEGCRRRFYLTKVANVCQQSDTVATTYGKQAHKAFEEYLQDGVPLEPRFAHFEPYVAPLKKFPGRLLCEHEMGLRADFTPCGFNDPDAWVRGIADFVVVDEGRGVARVGDFKTGKSARYADTSQLELMGAMVMQHFPAVHTIKGALLFVVSGDIIKADFVRGQMPDILSRWVGKTEAITTCIKLNVWNASPSGLCKFCPAPASACEHK
jgi:hypothetical protein